MQGHSNSLGITQLFLIVVTFKSNIINASTMHKVNQIVMLKLRISLDHD